MRPMVTVHISAVKPIARQSGQVLLFGSLFSLAVYASGLDAWLAQALYNPEARWPWVVRQWSGLLLGAPVVVGGLFLLLAPLQWRKKWALTRQTAVVMVLAVVLGMGLVSQVAFQSLADRPRPRESVLLNQPGAEVLSGRSMPSGHAAMAFSYTAPFFYLGGNGRQRRGLF